MSSLRTNLLPGSAQKTKNKRSHALTENALLYTMESSDD
jgi:hypothetical protein